MPLLELRILEIHSFPHFSRTCFDILSWNFAYDFVLLYYRSSLSVVNFCRSYAPFGTYNTENTQFSALFSYMLWYIELKFCIWLCITILQIKCDCRQFASIFVGVMPLWNVRNIQFSAFFSYMLWHIELKFCIWLCFTELQIKFECHQFASIFVGVMPLLELRILEIHSFLHFSLTGINILSWNLQMTLFYCTTGQLQVSSMGINFCRSNVPFGT